MNQVPLHQQISALRLTISEKEEYISIQRRLPANKKGVHREPSEQIEIKNIRIAHLKAALHSLQDLAKGGAT